MSSLTQRWLRQNIQLYSQKERVYIDVEAALARFSTLRPKSDVYIYDDGRSQLLLCIHGLLPISFRNASYNIPIAIWLTREYPRDPPIPFVIPTSGMLIKAGKYIDVSGRCNIQYIQHWARKNEACNLSALLEAMQEQFSREPPVYAKPPSGTAIQPPLSRDYRGKPPPPLPGSSVPTGAPSPPAPLPPMSSQPVASSSVSISDRPAIPPKPMLPDYLPSVDIRSPTPQSSDVTALGSSPPPPPPPRPPPPRTTSGVGPPQYRSSYVKPPVALSHSDNNDTFAGHVSVPRFSPADVDGAARLQASISTSSPAGAAFFPSSQVGLSSSPLYRSELSMRSRQQEAIASERPSVYPNLLDEDSPETPSVPPQNPSTAPPPRPPNPETLHLHAEVYHKLMSEFSSLSETLATDAERLRAHQTDLLNGEPAIRDEMSRLEAVRMVCSTVAGRMKGLVDQAETNIAELRRKGDPEVDELVCSTTIVHNQLVTLVAEDNAIEDTIYHLHRALSAGRIDLERFLRSTRLLAEEQFMKRALIEKIQAGIPMGWSMGSDDWS